METAPVISGGRQARVKLLRRHLGLESRDRPIAETDRAVPGLTAREGLELSRVEHKHPKSLIAGGELSFRESPRSAALRNPSTSRIQPTSRSLSSGIQTAPNTAISGPWFGRILVTT